MNVPSLLVMAAFALTVTSAIQAQQLGPAPDGCYKDLSGKISCPPMGGEVYVSARPDDATEFAG